MCMICSLKMLMTKVPFYGEKLSRQEGSGQVACLPEVTLGEVTFHTSPCKVLRTIDMRNQR